jgi:hypothetical protein
MEEIVDLSTNVALGNNTLWESPYIPTRYYKKLYVSVYSNTKVQLIWVYSSKPERLVSDPTVPRGPEHSFMCAAGSWRLEEIPVKSPYMQLIALRPDRNYNSYFHLSTTGEFRFKRKEERTIRAIAPDFPLSLITEEEAISSLEPVPMKSPKRNILSPDKDKLKFTSPIAEVRSEMTESYKSPAKSSLNDKGKEEDKGPVKKSPLSIFRGKIAKDPVDRLPGFIPRGSLLIGGPANSIQVLQPGSEGECLQIVNGVPKWSHFELPKAQCSKSDVDRDTLVYLCGNE